MPTIGYVSGTVTPKGLLLTPLMDWKEAQIFKGDFLFECDSDYWGVYQSPAGKDVARPGTVDHFIDQLLNEEFYLAVSEERRAEMIFDDRSMDTYRKVQALLEGEEVIYASNKNRLQHLPQEPKGVYEVIGWWNNGARAAVWEKHLWWGSAPDCQTAVQYASGMPLGTVRYYPESLADPLGNMRSLVTHQQRIKAWRASQRFAEKVYAH